ncbi:hypothetical protein ACWGTO_03100 [Mesorhizobium sp. PL10]
MTTWQGRSPAKRQYTETLQITNLATAGHLIHGSGRVSGRAEAMRENEAWGEFLALQRDFAVHQPILGWICRLMRKEFVRASKKYHTSFC